MKSTCPICGATMIHVASGDWYCPVCHRWSPIFESGTKKRRLGFKYPHKVTIIKGHGREELRHVYDEE